MFVRNPSKALQKFWTGFRLVTHGQPRNQGEQDPQELHLLGEPESSPFQLHDRLVQLLNQDFEPTRGPDVPNHLDHTAARGHRTPHLDPQFVAS